MSADSAVTYTSVHSEARSWSIPSEDPYEEAARQLLEQAPRSPEYIPDPIELEDHVPVYIPEPEHPEDLVPAEDEAPTPLLPPSFLSPPDIPEAKTPPRKRLLLTTPRTLRERYRDIRGGCDLLRDGQQRVQFQRQAAETNVSAYHIKAYTSLRLEHALTRWRTLEHFLDFGYDCSTMTFCYVL
ncbi:hypothetical protein Tco_0319382 [Tanacetum coccineum]